MPARFRRPIKRSPKSDPQQYRVYRMENEAIGARKYAKVPRAGIPSFVRSVCRSFGVPAAKVCWTGTLGEWAAEWDNGLIKLNSKKGTSDDIVTITHELAHHVHYCLAGHEVSEEQEQHGPEFMACHMSILDACRVIPLVGMRAVCDAWRVRYTDVGTRNSLATLKRALKHGRHSS